VSHLNRQQGNPDVIGEFAKHLLANFRQKAIPLVLMSHCTVAGYTPKMGIVMPMVIKQMTEVGMSFEQLDLESQ
jgi:hypothetical protein